MKKLHLFLVLTFVGSLSADDSSQSFGKMRSEMADFISSHFKCTSAFCQSVVSFLEGDSRNDSNDIEYERKLPGGTPTIKRSTSNDSGDKGYDSSDKGDGVIRATVVE